MTDEFRTIRLEPGIDEQGLWVEFAAPRLAGLRPNVHQICEYGFTEMVNNVIDHSGSSTVALVAVVRGDSVEMHVADMGVGIFRHLRDRLGLPDEHTALMELSKGRVTTDPDRHTGEGIFFSARMFDTFLLTSGGIGLVFKSGAPDWVHEQGEPRHRGTAVHMQIDVNSNRTSREIFDRFAGEDSGFQLDTTVLVLGLFHGEGERLVSRSQAKRLVAHLEQFKTVLLDFKGIDEIGPAFADEVFRVFARAHAGLRLVPVNASELVTRAILRASESESNGGGR